MTDTAHAHVLPLPSAVFDDDEPVLQSHPLLEGVEVPRFGQIGVWRFDAVRKPANISAAMWMTRFAGLDPVWNLRARETLMAVLNPAHPKVLEAGAHLRQKIAAPQTAYHHNEYLRQLARWAGEQGLPSDLGLWQSDDLKAWIAKRRSEITPITLSKYVAHVRLLVSLNGMLTGGGLARDPWPNLSNRAVAECASALPVTTKNITPEVWFAVVRAAWNYIHVFSPDILAARDRYRSLREQCLPGAVGIEERANAYFDRPDAIIPLHTERSNAHIHRRTRHNEQGAAINWQMLSLLLGVHPTKKSGIASNRQPAAERIRQRAAQMVAEGRGVPGGLLTEHAQITRTDGTTGPWHPGLCPRTLAHESTALRTATYLFVGALSMMRDSELREITRGSVVEHYGAPAVASTKSKLDEDKPREHWWITEPVAEAVMVAEQLSWHPDLIFVGADGAGLEAGEELPDSPWFYSGSALNSFVSRVNRHTADHGLHIPPGPIAPHMLRKTMSMLTATEPGGEIALGIQLKHVAVRALANRTTEGYGAPDANWAKLLDTSLEQVRFNRLSEFYATYKAGGVIGFGPGAEALTATFDAIKETALEMKANGWARQGDARVEYDLLRKAKISLRFGKFNHCMFDEHNPAGAKCMENTILPPGHRGPLIDRCQPGRCANSLIGVEHVKFYQSEKASLEKQLETKKLPPCRRASLQQQLGEVETVIAKVEE
ncbi:integrase [Streptomyces bacillaris]|uniref:integrase n=1 Tax=Streptomyces bacillaris TaxID=68179 RepID=UPI00363E5925